MSSIKSFCGVHFWAESTVPKQTDVPKDSFSSMINSYFTLGSCITISVAFERQTEKRLQNEYYNCSDMAFGIEDAVFSITKAILGKFDILLFHDEHSISL